MRYIRAFFKTIELMMQGQSVKLQADHYPRLQDWIKKAQALNKSIIKIAEEHQINESLRENIILHLDGRDWSMALILKSLDYHLSTEYHSLIQSTLEHNLTALYALNIDDQYRVNQLATTESLPDEVRAIILELAHHLQNIPSSNEL